MSIQMADRLARLGGYVSLVAITACPSQCDLFSLADRPSWRLFKRQEKLHRIC